MHLEELESHPELADGVCRGMESFDGRTIRIALWPAIQKKPKGTICLLQGRSEYIEKYYEVITELREKGFAVATLDWRGQGGSDRLLDDPYKGHIGKFEDYGKDLQQFMHDHVLPDCPLPYFALAHSMGGLILLNQLPKLRTILERTILSAPLIQLATEQKRFLGKSLRQKSLRRLAGLFRLFFMGESFVLGTDKTNILGSWSFNDNPLTSDGPRFDRNRNFLTRHPHLGIAGPTYRWVHESLKAMERLQLSDFQSSIHTPTLMMPASADTIVSTKATGIFARDLRAGHAITIAGSRHEILMERDIYREQFWAAFDAFIPGEASQETRLLSERQLSKSA
ncbi:MAG: alpha/beta hydrolase [Cohaesibacter sp.]|jgi:lysophospholipase|nr:alpha/beta hydrolase [Cohaesibacter sp.]